MDWDISGKLAAGRIPIPDYAAMYTYLNSDDCDFLAIPHAHAHAEHPVRLRKVYKLDKVKRPTRPEQSGIDGVRYGVYEVCTDCPPSSIAHRRLPHWECDHCFAKDWGKCPLSFAGKPTVHKF